MNLIRPESETPVHTRITAKYRFSTKREPDADKLEESETAAEYVSKAVQNNLFGSRLREPINIPAQNDATDQRSNYNSEEEEEKSIEKGHSHKYFDPSNQEEQRQLQQQQQRYHKQQQQQRQQEQQQQRLQEQQLLHEQQQQRQQEQQQQRLQEQQHLQEHQQQRQQEQEQQSQVELKQSQQQLLQSQTLLEAQILAANQAYDAQTNQFENVSQQSVSSYDNSDTGNPYDTSSIVDRQYRAKYKYQPYKGTEDRVRFVEDKLRVSASTEVPRAEIMKQIEKSVIKYMKELEAEGKIITAPQEPKQYYHIVTVPNEENHLPSSTSKPRAITISYHGTRLSAPQKSSVAYHHNSKYHPKSHYQNDNDHHYQTAQSQQQLQSQRQVAETADQLAPNVEFIYKIKTRAPLQTATVKTVSKPYTLPFKSTTYEKFDHSAALKNMEEFDLSHVVTTEDTDEPLPQSGKPNKLYFNSEIYHDINSLPFKPEKAMAIAEYRKLKTNYDHPDYKGYGGGYFAEPISGQGDKQQSADTAASDLDDGYPVMNPYKFVLKKEAVPAGLEDPHAVANWEQQRVHNSKPLYSVLSAQKALEYDSYSPKFNNNPEGYGYQHSVKSIISGERETSNQKYLRGHSLVKRGKRGNAHAHAHKKPIRTSSVKDIEANIALRPPPKL